MWLHGLRSRSVRQRRVSPSDSDPRWLRWVCSISTSRCRHGVAPLTTPHRSELPEAPGLSGLRGIESASTKALSATGVEGRQCARVGFAETAGSPLSTAMSSISKTAVRGRVAASTMAQPALADAADPRDGTGRCRQRLRHDRRSWSTAPIVVSLRVSPAFRARRVGSLGVVRSAVRGAPGTRVPHRTRPGRPAASLLRLPHWCALHRAGRGRLR